MSAARKGEEKAHPGGLHWTGLTRTATVRLMVAVRIHAFAPAKINLTLRVTGRRPDGYHDLLSLVSLIELGDRLTCSRKEGRGADELRLSGNCDGLSAGADNLVLRAVSAFRQVTGIEGRYRIALEKRIPSGSGLGGGSSDAVCTIEALCCLEGIRFEPEAWASTVSGLGSDCPLFLHAPAGPVILSGRGEGVVSAGPSAGPRISSRRLLLFQPPFRIATPWAFGQLAQRGAYASPAEAEEHHDAWLRSEEALAALPRNDFEDPVYRKFPVYEVLAKRLGRTVCLTGSGSAAFVLLGDEEDAGGAMRTIRDELGPEAFVTATRFL